MRRVGRWRGLDNVSHRLESMGRPNGEEEAPLVDTVVRIFWTVLPGPMAHLGTAPNSFFSIFSGKMRPAFPASRSFSPAAVDFDSLLHALSDRSIHFHHTTVPQVGLR